ncbi:MAG: LPS assembly lipoprotein LptE [Flavobacteriaceae bacterium]|jgi:hypothetical protein|nr:LPS assembly lipoprotein LptE [Flavobacteriaceae bacterium]
MTLKSKGIGAVLGMLTLALSGCYSFTGSSLDPGIKTLEIRSFPNYSAYQSPNLSVDFTTSLQNRFNQRTRLQETKIDPDILLEGEITDFSTNPVSIRSGSDEATQNRLTITVAVRYENKVQPEKSFERTFSDYEDYSSTELLINIQDELAQKINQRIIDQIFTAIVADW